MSQLLPEQINRRTQGGFIDRSRPLNFQFNGRTYTGFAGDTLASALLACNVQMLSRSFKYHRPRGIFTAGEEEPNALLEIGEGARREPTVRAPVVSLFDGLVARSQNCWPSVDFDVGRVLDYTHALWPAGFYNKTFKWPNWHFWEDAIRHTAGLGRPLTEADPDRYEQLNLHCDVLVCGGGPTGLIAALTAGRAGLRVLLVEQGKEFGGVLNWEHCELNLQSGREWVQSLVLELASLPNVMLLPKTIVTGCYDHNVTTLLQRSSGLNWRECYWTVRPKHIVLASGAIEQGMIFRNNDRPGIMLAGAARHYLNRFAVTPNAPVILATNNDTAYQTVLDLREANIPIDTVIEAREAISPALQLRMKQLGVEVLTGSRVADTRGDTAIRELSIESLNGASLGRRECKLLAISGGWAPRVHLFCHARGELKFDASSQSFKPHRLPKNFMVIGSANGTAGLAECLAEAGSLVSRVCAELGAGGTVPALPLIQREPMAGGQVRSLPLDRSKSRQWIDLAHDVTVGDAELAVREGYVSVEHFKRYTTTGMSVDQGKTGNLNAFIALGGLTGQDMAAVGTTTFRPPYMPVTLGAIAGPYSADLYAPKRLLPAHQLHVRLNACIEDYAGWQRPACYPAGTEDFEAAIQREVLAVRSSVGLFDNSPIGKIEVRGPDAAEFLDHFYINNVLNLEAGRVRYGLMLNERGIIIDDGVFMKLADHHYLLNTTSGGAGRICEMLEEWWQCEWPDSQVLIDDVTTQWANFTIAGPKARELIGKLGTNIDLSAQALPHMAVCHGKLAGLDVRIVRVSFSGELSYEINLPAGFAEYFMQAVLQAGAEFAITPYGVESLFVLRTEKGYLHLGSDTDGSTIPDDVGWGRVARNKSTDYIGKRSLQLEANQSQQRQQLIGLKALDVNQVMRPGAHLRFGDDDKSGIGSAGWISSACFSPNLKTHIALAVLRGGRDKLGEIVTVLDEEERYQARVVPPVFLDPENHRLSL